MPYSEGGGIFSLPWERSIPRPVYYLLDRPLRFRYRLHAVRVRRPVPHPRLPEALVDYAHLTRVRKIMKIVLIPHTFLVAFRAADIETYNAHLRRNGKLLLNSF